VASAFASATALDLSSAINSGLTSSKVRIPAGLRPSNRMT
jgi:hypothetical protein